MKINLSTFYLHDRVLRTIGTTPPNLSTFDNDHIPLDVVHNRRRYSAPFFPAVCQKFYSSRHLKVFTKPFDAWRLRTHRKRGPFPESGPPPGRPTGIMVLMMHEEFETATANNCHLGSPTYHSVFPNWTHTLTYVSRSVYLYRGHKLRLLSCPGRCLYIDRMSCLCRAPVEIETDAPWFIFRD